jgi:hypothetical protein
VELLRCSGVLQAKLPRYRNEIYVLEAESKKRKRKKKKKEGQIDGHQLVAKVQNY